MNWKITLSIEFLYGAATPSRDWPSTIPEKFQRKGFYIQPKSNVARTEVDQGPDYQRPRYSVRSEEMTGDIIVTDAELTAFNNFYNNTTSGGALRFVMKHPISGNDEVAQFNVENPPRTVAV